MIALWWAACGIPADRPTNSGAVYPHPTDYGEAVHGPDALADGAPCLGCHGVDEGQLVRGAVPSAPSCRSCHADFPHSDGYGTTDTHGTDWAARNEDCTACHAADGARAPADQRDGLCAGCHSSYPHSPGWDAPAAHGAAVFARSAAACASCHDDSVGQDQGECAACHAVYPHAKGFGDTHPASWANDQGASCTTSCHPAASAVVAPKVACASCHDLFPHAAGWPEGHVTVVQSRGEGACRVCHESGTPAGPTMPLSCGATCHGGEP